MKTSHGLTGSRLAALAGALLLAMGIACTPTLPASPKQARIGYLASTSAGPSPLRHAFVQSLAALGRVEGKDVIMEYRSAENQPQRFTDLAEELVKLQVDVIVVTGTPGAVAAKRATSTIPIVIIAAGDAVGSGLVASLAQPGGNVTGLTQISPQLNAKRLQLLKDALPTMTRVGVISNPTNSANVREWEESQESAAALGLTPRLLEVRSVADIEPAFQRAAAEGIQGLIVLADPVTNSRQDMVDLALAAQLPAMYGWRDHADRGGLMAYGPNPADLYRRAASFVDKILKGARPAELPVEQPSRFDMVVNARTADALGLVLPSSVIQQATEVIR